MNKVYRIIWSHANEAWVVASELSRGRSKSSTGSRKRTALAAVLVTLPVVAGAQTVEIGNSGTPVLLQNTGPANSTTFNVAPAVVINTPTNGVLGDASQDWSFTNRGSITGATSGLRLSSATAHGATVDNFGSLIGLGTLTSGANAGVYLGNGGTLTNHEGAVINSNSDALYAVLAGTTVINNGAMQADITSVYFNDGGIFTQGATGTLDATSYGLIGNGAGTTTASNAGRITGGVTAVWYQGGAGTLTNTGTLSGATGAVFSTDGHALTNSGTIEGTAGDAIQITGNNNAITLQTGSTLNGNIASTGTGNTLRLEGAGSEDSDLTGLSTLTMAGSSDWLLDGSVSTTAAVANATHVQSGRLIVGGAVTQAVGGGATIDSGATLQLGNGDTTGSITGAIANQGVLAFNRSDVLTFSQVISGTGSVSQVGTGTLALTGANTYGGGTTISAGTLSGSATSFGSGNILDNAALILNQPANATFANVISGTGSVTKQGAGVLTMTGDNTYTGVTTVTAGALQLGNGGASGWLAGDVVNNATLLFNRSDEKTYAGAITGTGVLRQIGTGTTILTGDISTRLLSANNGELRLESGAHVITTGVGANDIISISGPAAVVTVSGEGSLLDSGTQRIWLGDAGANENGTLNIEAGGDVDGGSVVIGRILPAGSQAILNVSGVGSTLTAGRIDMATGSGRSEANVTAGGSVTSTSHFFGFTAGSLDSPDEAVLVSGAGSSWTNTIDLRLYTGTLSVLDGGVYETRIAIVGSYSFDANAFTGTLRVSGAGSRFTSTGAVTLGGEDTTSGILNLSDGATFVAGGAMTIGQLAGSTGTINIGGVAGDPAEAAGVFQGASVAFGLGTGELNFNHTDSTYAFDAVISGGATGTVNQNGTGTTILGGANSYLGATNVNAGTLRVNGDQSAATGLVSVGSGATLGGSGTLGGAVTVADGGHLAPGNSPETLTMGTLTLNDGSILDFELGEANVVGGELNDLINVNGDLTLDGLLRVTPSADGTYGAGIYRLINYTGTLIDNELELDVMPAGSINYVQTSIAQQVNLVNTQGLLLNYWDGPAVPRNNGAVDGGDGVWLASPGNEHWTSAEGAINAPYQDAAMAIFAGTAGTVSVDDSLGAIRVSGLQFASDGYRIEGDAITLMPGLNAVRVGEGTSAGAAFVATIASELTGDGALGKTDLGTLVLTGANTHTGGTTISAGTLQLGDGGASGSVVGDIANEGELAFNRSDAVSFDGVISGTGAVNQLGAGTTTLTGVSTYTGVTTISAGTLALSGAGSIASSSGVVTNGSFDITATDAGASITTLSGSGQALLGEQTLTLTAASGSFDGVVSSAGAGLGTLDKSGSGTWTLSGAGSQVGALNVQAGTLALASTASLASQTTTVATGTTLSNDGTFTGTADADSFTLAGTLIGTASFLDGDDQVVIEEGASFAQASFDGGAGVDTLDLTHATALTLPATLTTNFEQLIKRGVGALTLSGTVDGFSDSIVLAEGTAVLSSATVTTNELRLESGATLSGTGSVSGALVNNGTLSAGMSPGTIAVGGNFTQSASGMLISEITRAGTDLIDVTGSATLAGAHQIQIEYGLYLDGTTHTLVQADGGVIGNYANVAVNPSALMSADHQVGATAETVSFTRQSTTTIADPGTNRGRYAQWLEEQISDGGVTPELEAYIDTLLLQPTAEQASNLLGEIAEPVAAVSQNNISMLGAGFAGGVFQRFAVNGLAQCTATQESSDALNCAWVHGLRQWGGAAGDSFGPRYDWTTDGAQFGIDRRLTDWTLGATFGYAQTDTNDIRGGHNELNSKMGGLYANYDHERISFGAVALYGRNENSTSRHVAIGNTTQQARAQFDSDSYGAGLRLGYRLTSEVQPLVQPFAEVFYDRVDGASFTERAAGAGVRLQDREGLRGTLGVQLANSYEGYGQVWRPSLELGAVHQFEDTQSTLEIQPLANSPSFRAYGTELDRTSYVANASLGVSLGTNASLLLGYSGEVAEDYSRHEISLSFRVAW